MEEWLEEKNDKDVEKITAGSNYRAWWRCKECQHEWKVKVANRVNGQGCPYCAGRYEIPLIQIAPHLIEEWIEEKNDKDFEEITSGSGYKAWWRCKDCQHVWPAIVQNRVKKNGCPRCAGMYDIPLIDDHLELKNEWIKEKNDKEIAEITTGSKYKAWWRCKECQHEWQAIVQNRVRGSGCPRRCTVKHVLVQKGSHLGLLNKIIKMLTR